MLIGLVDEALPAVGAWNFELAFLVESDDTVCLAVDIYRFEGFLYVFDIFDMLDDRDEEADVSVCCHREEFLRFVEVKGFLMV